MVLHMPLRKWSFEKKNGAINSHFVDISFSVHTHIKNCQKRVKTAKIKASIKSDSV